MSPRYCLRTDGPRHDRRAATCSRLGCRCVETRLRALAEEEEERPRGWRCRTRKRRLLVAVRLTLDQDHDDGASASSFCFVMSRRRTHQPSHASGRSGCCATALRGQWRDKSALSVALARCAAAVSGMARARFDSHLCTTASNHHTVGACIRGAAQAMHLLRTGVGLAQGGLLEANGPPPKHRKSVVYV